MRDPVTIIKLIKEYLEEGHDDRFVSELLSVPIAVVRWVMLEKVRPQEVIDLDPA